jgi:carbon storage regulator
MLVLSRKKGERIVIGQDIELLVVEMGARRVKLAIGAPQNVPIRRGELCGPARPLAVPGRGVNARPASRPGGGTQA